MHQALLLKMKSYMSRSSLLPLLSESFPAKLLAAAENMISQDLSWCVNLYFANTFIDSVAYILALADRYRATELKSICPIFSAENLDGEFSSLTLTPQFYIWVHTLWLYMI